MARLWMLVGSSPTRHLFKTPGLSRADRVGPEIGAGQARTVWWAASDTPTPEPTNLRAVGKPAGRRSVSPTPADFAWRAEFQKVRILRLEVPSRFLERRSGQQLLGKQRLAGWWKFRQNPTRRCQAASQPAAKGVCRSFRERERERHTHTRSVPAPGHIGVHAKAPVDVALHQHLVVFVAEDAWLQHHPTFTPSPQPATAILARAVSLP